MTGLAEVVRRHGQHYIAQHRGRLLPSHVRALRAIATCRTAALGGHLAHCSSCDTEHLLYHSCRHRACPQCGHAATQRWLSRQRELMLPVPYFHVVFTLPAELRRVVRAHQRALLPVLFRAAFDSLAALAADPKFVGGQIGALAVLHTWTRTLEWHPHLRVLVPGGALASDGRTWRPIRARNKRFLVPVKALAQRFRGRFLHLARRSLPSGQLPHVPWSSIRSESRPPDASRSQNVEMHPAITESADTRHTPSTSKAPFNLGNGTCEKWVQRSLMRSSFMSA